MNYFDCVKLQKIINEQYITVAELRENSVSVSSVCSDGMPKSNSSGSGIERKVEILEVEEAKLEHFRKQLNRAINSIPDQYIQKLIRLRIFKKKSWNWIAYQTQSGVTSNGIRMLCVRYRWEVSTDC